MIVQDDTSEIGPSNLSLVLQKELKALWCASYPGTELCWCYRGGGFISLTNLLFFARNYPKSFQELLRKPNGDRAIWEYPFAVAAVNITFMLIQMLDLQQYWTQGSLEKNKALVEYLKQYGAVRTDKVAEIMETIDRALFVPEGFTPYIDSPMPIGYNATISAPHMHATCLELLKDHLQPGMHALDVGSGSGYLTACFAMMVGPEGRAVGIEHIPELVAASTENVERSAAAPLLKDGSLSFHVSDGRLGWPDAAPYDAIHVGAAASEIPRPLLEQLKPGGRMVIPVGTYSQDLQVIDKNTNGSTSVRNDASVRYVPLTSRSAQLQDS